jgi:uncharacterized DUF497 family protein
LYTPPTDVDSDGGILELEWDEDKRQATFRERGVDIAYAALIFLDEVFTHLDDRRDYGEERYISVGFVGDQCFVVVHTERENVIRVITAWKGGRNDRKKYEESLARRIGPDAGQG